MANNILFFSPGSVNLDLYNTIYDALDALTDGQPGDDWNEVLSWYGVTPYEFDCAIDQVWDDKADLVMGMDLF